MFLKSPSDVLIPVDGHKLELVTHRPVPSALVQRWDEERLCCAQPRDLQRSCFILASLTGCVLFFFFSILLPLQIQTRTTSGNFLTMQLNSRVPVGLVFNFSETPKSPSSIFTKIILYIVFNLRFSCFSLRWCWIESFRHVFRLLLPMEPWLHAVGKFSYMNYSELYFYICTLHDCLL